jgi:phosphate starvation-inducible protein PhoH
MVSLLGTRDELLKLIEAAFVSTVFVRGNEITITGEQADAERVARLFQELITLLERGVRPDRRHRRPFHRHTSEGDGTPAPRSSSATRS